MAALQLSDNVCGVYGVGRNIKATQETLFSSKGLELEGTRACWHLQLSDLKHAFLTRVGQNLVFVIKEFGKPLENATSLRPTGSYVGLDRQQTVDFVFAMLDLIPTARRHDITKVR